MTERVNILTKTVRREKVKMNKAEEAEKIECKDQKNRTISVKYRSKKYMICQEIRTNTEAAERQERV